MIISYIIAVLLRLIPFLLLGSLPFYDPWEYYDGILDYTTGELYLSNEVFRRGHPGFYSLLIVVYTLTGLPLLQYSLLFPPLFNSLSILPMYLLVREFFKNEKAAFISTIFFSAMEIIVLRQSYLVPEGFAVYLMLLTFFYLFKDPYPKREWSQASICFILFYCLCSMHNLTSTMTLIPLLFTLLAFGLPRTFKTRIREILPVSRSLRFIILSIGLSFIWIFWGKEVDYAGFIGNFLALNIEALLISLSGTSTPTPEGFTEHYTTTQGSSSLLNLVAMNAGSLIITLVGIISFIPFLRKYQKETSHIFLIFWIISMFINFVLNIVIDSLFSGRTYAQQAYRAWIFFIIPVIIIASLKIAEIQNERNLYIFMTVSLVFCLIGSLWFNMFLINSYPHIRNV
ncbi:hypothetical protein [Candidatus Borrarchaeum sp.]|uniref:hypothetical protein n=1 Tax=Candidatus Borrarchaeum sp. TaxID=2846742 RepID=UPI00257CBBBE|nr:hypothetical protein [Candidatus Borrarchaeum sp.]